MRKKQVAAGVLSAAMVASFALTGCGSDSATTTAAATKEETKSETKAEETKAEETKAEETKAEEEEGSEEFSKEEAKGDSASDKIPTDLGVDKIGNGETLVIGLQQNSFIESYESDKNWFTKYLEDKLGVKIEFYMMPAETTDFQTKMSLMATGGEDMPDIIMTFGNLTDVMILDYGSKGIFIPLEDYLNNEEMSPHWAAIPEEDKKVMQTAMTSADGHIYGLAKYEPETWNLTPYRYFINEAWLDKLGLEVPKTTDELKEVLTAFVNEDPNGNGQKDEIGAYGYAEGGYGQNTVWALMNSFTFFEGTGTKNGGLALAEDGKTVIAPWMTDEWRQGLQYMKDLYDNGLLAASIFSDDDTQWKATLNNETNIVGLVTAGSNSQAWPDNDNNANFQEMQIIPPFEGPNGVKYTPYSEYSPTIDFFVTSNCKNPELAYKFGEAFYDYEISMTERFGEKGVDWSDDPEVCADQKNAMVAAGVEDHISITQQLGEKKIWAETNSKFWHNVGPRYAPLSIGNTVADGSKEFDETLKSNMVGAYSYEYYYEAHPEKVLPQLKYTAEEADENTSPIMEITDLIKTSTAEFVTGQRTLDDTGWENFKTEMENLGLQTWLENAQAAYDRTLN